MATENRNNDGSKTNYLLLASVLLVMTSRGAALERKQYAMYVWTKGYDHSIAGCDGNAFLQWNTHGPCFTHVWNTEAKRKWLWNTCNVTGREISAIFISDVHHNLKHAYDTGDCTTSDITMVKQMITEGHSQVPNLKIYGLYAVSDIDVSEKDLVKYIVHYNDMCATSDAQRFDGVAVNNEAYAGIKCGDMAKRLKYLDNLKVIRDEAGKQKNGKLLTHYSVSWHWGRCSNQPSIMTWEGKSSDVVHHMIDIFDSIDVQVGYIIHPQISDRVKIAGYEYAKSQGKDIYVTVYTNKASPCQITFFSNTACHVHGHTEASMFEKFDALHTHGIGYAKPCIHYFRGIYSSGGNTDWPLHNGQTQDQGAVVG